MLREGLSFSKKCKKGALTREKSSTPRRSANKYVCHRGTAVKSAKIRQSRDKFASGDTASSAKTIYIIEYFRGKVNKKSEILMDKKNGFEN